MTSPALRPRLFVRETRDGQPVYEAVWRHQGKQIKRRIGPAWLVRRGASWSARAGRTPREFFDEPAAHVKAARMVEAHTQLVAERERAERARADHGPTFRELAHAYLGWLEDVKRAKPATLSDYRHLLAEPGTPHKRGDGVTLGRIMAALGDLPVRAITVREIEQLLSDLSEAGVSARSINKHRSVVSAIFGYGMKASTIGLPLNPVTAADRRREGDPVVLLFYKPEEIEAIAIALTEGRHRAPERHETTAHEIGEDRRDAELIRLAAYAGLRQGELLALRWRDVDFAAHAITVSRAMSDGVETSTKSRRVRRIPMPDQAAAALQRLSGRGDFIAPDELVFCNSLGRHLNGSALRRRFKRACAAVGIRALRFHDLRHTYGSLLAAAGVDLVTIQAAMGHSALATTSRYLHARPANEQATLFTEAFRSHPPERRAHRPQRSRKRGEAAVALARGALHPEATGEPPTSSRP